MYKYINNLYDRLTVSKLWHNIRAVFSHVYLQSFLLHDIRAFFFCHIYLRSFLFLWAFYPQVYDHFLTNAHIFCVFTHVASIYAKVIGTKESVYIRKEFNSHRIVLGHRHGHRFIVLGHKYRGHDVTWKHTICAQKKPIHMCYKWGHRESSYCWFPHDVTKIQTKKTIDPTEILLEQLKTNFHTNFRLKRVPGFVSEFAWISKLLRNAAFTWRPRELSCRFKKWLISGNFAI